MEDRGRVKKSQAEPVKHVLCTVDGRAEEGCSSSLEARDHESQMPDIEHRIWIFAARFWFCFDLFLCPSPSLWKKM